jgi:uncharacterized protein (DUF58 family)
VSLAGLRGASVLALGAAAYAAAWAFGSRPLAVVGLGLACVGAAALAWRRLVPGSMTLAARLEPARACEGERATMELALDRGRAIPLASTTVDAEWPRLGAHHVALRGRGAVARGEIVLDRLPRGIHAASRVVATLEDPFGLEPVSRELQPPPPLIVHPRVVRLDALFAHGLLSGGATRVRRPRAGSGDVRSVRPYRAGEPLRSVHWPSTARRGALMLRELEEPGDGGLVILLDCDPVAAWGELPDTPFEAAVRAAGSIAVSVAASGRDVLVCTNGRADVAVRVGPQTVAEALDALAGIEADAPGPLLLALSRPHGPVARAGDLVVVTATADGGSTAALRARAGALVWVDAASWADRRVRRGPGRAAWVVALAAAGVPVATVGRGDDLALALGAAAPSRERA